MNSRVQAIRIANRIVANEDGWWYDNCKVRIEGLSAASLTTVIFRVLERQTEPDIIRAWMGAVYDAHGAVTDRMARDGVRYVVGCFQKRLNQVRTSTDGQGDSGLVK